MLPCLRHVEGIRLVGISSPNRERVAETARIFGIERSAADHREILEVARPDLVFVATPPHRHAEMAVDALDAGCHVVCEKPMARDARESRRMLEAADRHPDLLSLIDHELRFHPGRIALKERIEIGGLGEVHNAAYHLHSFSRRDAGRPWSWWSDAAAGGGALGAIGSHAVDALVHLLGPVADVRGRLTTVHPFRPDPETGRPRPVTADDRVDAELRFSSGASARIHLSLVERERVHRITVAGSMSTARLDEQGPLRIDPVRWEGERIDVDWGLPGAEELGIPDTDWARSFLIQARKIVEALRRGRPLVPRAATFADGHRTQRILDAIRRSSERAVGEAGEPGPIERNPTSGGPE
ncbi:MAG: gfo/Idh/MocA family oxidoreductase [Candidatus Latescibacteria bacterium]|nr:gfo/Idh/MocA family oxidoreductase [Candidatus Latescibacterota bacterium]